MTLPRRDAVDRSTERRWIDGVRAGDRWAFTEAFQALFPALRVFVFRYTRSIEQAEEIAQDVFVAWWEERGRLTIRDGLRSYLFTAAKHRALNQLRHERVAKRFAIDVSMDGPPSISDTDHATREHEVAQAIVDAVNALPPARRRVFMLHRSERLSYAEIAARLDISARTVETQLARALRTLRDRLAVFRS